MNEEQEPVVTQITEEQVVNNIDSEQKKKGTKKFLIILIVLLVIAITLVLVYFLYYKKKDNKKETNTTTTEVVTSNLSYKMTGNDLQDFDIGFLQLEASEENMVYSPLSIKYALAMLSEGSNGETKAQIDAVIGDYIAKKYDNSKNMSFANAMFIRNTYRNYIKEDYTKNLETKFNANVVYDEFKNASNINSWISNKTNGLINDLVTNDKVDGSDYYLVNALSIDMNWKHVLQAISNACEVYDLKIDPETYSCPANISYNATYPHEDYQEVIYEIGRVVGYSPIEFNGKENKLAVEIGSSINNYDIVTTLGKENIRKEIKAEYINFLTEEDGCLGEGYNSTSEALADVDNYVDRFINDLDSSYKRVDISTDYKFYVDDDIKVFEKELQEYNDTALEYIAIMPVKDSLSKYIENATAESVATDIAKLKEIKLENFESGYVTKIFGYIPLFKYDYELNLLEDLKKIGIKDVFNEDSADLSNLTSNKSYIDEASHKATIEFSNYGIKATAATAMGGIGAESCSFEHLYEVPVKEIDLTFDKPFMYIVRDKNTKEVWFTGTVYEPLDFTDDLAGRDS